MQDSLLHALCPPCRHFFLTVSLALTRSNQFVKSKIQISFHALTATDQLCSVLDNLIQAMEKYSLRKCALYRRGGGTIVDAAFRGAERAGVHKVVRTVSTTDGQTQILGQFFLL